MAQASRCMSGLSHPRLLVAGHIVPWERDKANRLNPRNGLLLSTLHDKAFDVGPITISEDHTRDVLLPLEGRRITMPERFTPDPVFLAHHRDMIFEDA